MARLHFGSNRDQAKPKKVVGRLRKTQLITTFGNGSIVDMPDYSVIMAGSNYWKDNSPVLHEPNLEKLLKVSCFKEPYVSNSQDDDMTPDVPAFRFPYYHFCPDPNCGRLMPYWGFGDVTDRSCANGHPKRNIVPSRFIAACTNGHLEDFPYEWWVHYGNFSECPADKRNGALRISFSDETGGLDSIVIKCTACGKSRTMAGSMAKDALRGYSCHGKRPWLGSKKEYNDPVSCTAQLRVLQRGASNVYFSMTASALTIPPWSSKVQQEIAVRWEQIEDILDSNPDEYVLRAVVQSVFHSLLEMQICTIDELISEIKKRYNDGNGGEYTKQNLLEDEYRVFCMGDYDDPEDVQFRIARATVPEFLEDYIEDIVLAKRLREVLALRGFRRITPEQPNADDDRFKGYHLSGDCVPLSDVELNWLPAIEMLGEGLFIKIREDALEEWEDAFENEYQPMRTRLEHSNVGCENFSARYVLLHTLSHLLIRQLSLECGYSGASIKERIYSTYPESDVKMAGILLYTSSSDSDGSLGGLVRKGLPESFEMIFRNMLQEASWCSSDPICIESHAQGYDSLNYAACHACSLLPETSCEMRNCLLDRAAVVGTIKDRERGFFGALLE